MYNEKYEGYWSMRWHDEDSDLQRWFDNYKVDRNAYVSEREWLTIEEYSWACRGKKITRYDGTIGADHDNRKRLVRFETGAPPPPTFMQPVKIKYVPPTPQELYHAKQMHDKMERDMRAMSGYMWKHRFTPQQRFMADVLLPVTPPPPRYRRN